MPVTDGIGILTEMHLHTEGHLHLTKRTMKQVYIINENHPQLLLFFAGWAADETPFKQYRPKDMDYMICYDYRTLDFDYSIFDRYRQVNVVAWSMGVWMGSLILSQVSRDKVFSLAFNGTTYPIDNLEGIPVKTFQATLDGLTPATLQKFLRRMCKDSNAYKAFMEVTPRRDFDEIKEELRLILERYFDLFGDANNKSYDEERKISMRQTSKSITTNTTTPSSARTTGFSRPKTWR